MNSAPLSPNELISSLQWRYATKLFDTSKKIPSDVWSALEQSLVLTPSSLGLQPWKFITITDQATKEKLLPHSWNQVQVTDCSHLLVLCAKTKTTKEDVDSWLSQLTKTRKTSLESLEGYANMMHGYIGNMDDTALLSWATNQVFIALGQLTLAAALLKIDTCPLGGIINTEYDRILELKKTGYQTTIACPMGYRLAEDKYASVPKVRFPDTEILSTIE